MATTSSTATRDDRIVVTYNHDDHLLLHRALHHWLGTSPSPVQPVHGGILCFPPGLTRYDFYVAVSEFLSLGWPVKGRFYHHDRPRSWIEVPFGA